MSYSYNYVLFALFVGVVTYVDRVCKVGSLDSVAVTVNVVAFDFGKVERFGTRFNGEFAAYFEPYNLLIILLTTFTLTVLVMVSPSSPERVTVIVV